MESVLRTVKIIDFLGPLEQRFATLKASFWGLFKTNFYGRFRKLFLFTKFNFLNFRKKFFLTILKSMCLEFCASNYVVHLIEQIPELTSLIP